MEYEDQIQSDKVDLVYPPILNDFNYNNITFYNETGGLSFFIPILHLHCTQDIEIVKSNQGLIALESECLISRVG